MLPLRARTRAAVLACVASALTACTTQSAAPAATDASVAPGNDAGDAGESNGNGVDSGADADAVAAFPDDRGPGVFGALPSGYCCTKDAECKGRRCVDPGSGTRMCEDACSTEADCDVPKTPFDCTLTAGQSIKTCTPPAGVACIPASTFVRGTKVTGACCAFANGQVAGADCASHLCVSAGDGPYHCSNRCEVPADCPPDFKCETSGGTGWIPTCIPLAVYSGGTYTCK
jgi:hypothetical protein